MRTTQQYVTADWSGDAAIRFDEQGDFSIRKEETTADGGKGIDVHYTSLRVTTLTGDGEVRFRIQIRKRALAN